jgi:glycosyltransferase involved in cell wall biosynthesis
MRRLRVCFLFTGGFSNWPALSLGSLRGALSLSELVDLRVICLRAWKPGRSVVSTQNHGGLSITTLALLQVPRAPAVNVRVYRRLGWPFFRRILPRCDVVHSVDVVGAGLVASFWARRTGTAHVVQAIGSDVNTLLPRLQARKAISGWQEWVHGVSANSRALASLFHSLYPDVRNVRTIYRGVDLKRFHPEGPRAGPLATCPPMRFLFLGGFSAYPTLPHGANTKGGETLLAAWRAAEPFFEAPHPSLLVAGPDSDIESLARWRASLRFPERVHIEGLLPSEEMPAYLRSADVILQPSMQEGLPNVAMEASACARPIFGSAIGGIEEVVISGETGLTLPPGDVGRWAEGLVEYSKKPAEVRRMGERARLLMERTFDANKYAPETVELYRAALEEASRASS